MPDVGAKCAAASDLWTQHLHHSTSSGSTLLRLVGHSHLNHLSSRNSLELKKHRLTPPPPHLSSPYSTLHFSPLPFMCVLRSLGPSLHFSFLLPSHTISSLPRIEQRVTVPQTPTRHHTALLSILSHSGVHIHTHTLTRQDMHNAIHLTVYSQ